MNETMVKLATYTVTAVGGDASVIFSNIPQGYTDLKIVMSARDNRSGYAINSASISFNTGGTYSGKELNAYNLTTIASSSSSSWSVPSPVDTANVFSNTEIYIPNYTSNSAKVFSIDSAVEGNSSYNALDLVAGLWSGTSAITSITITPSGSASFAQYSTFTLYGIKNFATTVGNSVKATGGLVTTDGTYTYHTFLSTGTFSPTTKLLADVLVVAGGGSGGNMYAGGGGAGGVVYQSFRALYAGVNYTCAVGAGGAANSNATALQGNNGTNSSFDTLTGFGGGGGGSYAVSGAVGLSGGSGGGAAMPGSNGTVAGASATQTSNGGGTGYGNAGGASLRNGGIFLGGGGGGAGGAGAAASGSLAGVGGIGLSTWTSWHYATNTGVNSGGTYYIAGGGGGGAEAATANFGGIGGGGKGGLYGAYLPGNGVANTGGGGGAVGGNLSQGSTGGSGLIIVRYKA